MLIKVVIDISDLYMNCVFLGVRFKEGWVILFFFENLLILIK